MSTAEARRTLRDQDLELLTQQVRAAVRGACDQQGRRAVASGLLLQVIVSAPAGSLDAARRRGLEACANDEWSVHAGEVTDPAVRLRFDDGDTVQAVAAGCHPAEALAETELRLEFNVLPGLEVTVGAVRRVALFPDDEEPLRIGRNTYLAFPADALRQGADPGLLARFDLHTNRVEIQRDPSSTWRMTLDGTEVPCDSWLALNGPTTISLDPIDVDADAHPWRIGISAVMAPPHDLTADEVAALLKRASERLRTGWVPADVMGQPGSRTVTFPMQDRRGVIRYLHAWCVYARASKVTAAGGTRSVFGKFYFCQSAAAAEALGRDLANRRALAAELGEAVVPITQYHVGQDADGQATVYTATVGMRTDMTLLDDPGLPVHAVVVESPWVEPYTSGRARLTIDGLDALRPLAVALDRAHARGVVVGDLKSPNITIGQVRDGELPIARVLDLDSVTRSDSPVWLGRRTDRYSLPALRSSTSPRDPQAMTLVHPETYVANDIAGFVALTLDLLLGDRAGCDALDGDAAAAEEQRGLVGAHRVELIARVAPMLAAQQDPTAVTLGAPLSSCEAWLDALKAEGRVEPRQQAAESAELARLRASLVGHRNAFHLRELFDNHVRSQIEAEAAAGARNATLLAALVFIVILVIGVIVL